ncbi:MAG: metallophosphoesterase family protein [Hyphomonadaceae bacterium]
MLRLFNRSASPVARFLDGRVGFAVGDIHGRADLLADMIQFLEARSVYDTRLGGPPIVIFLGDYVDRGHDSAGVLELLSAGRPRHCECRFLRGNHEQSLIAFLDDPSANRGWLLQGGAETLLSYGVRPPAFNSSQGDWLHAARELRDRIPALHHAFLNSLERYVEFGDYAFVHAGVDPARALKDQTDEALYWSREAFIASKRDFSHRIVHGHTPVDEPYADRRRIAIDTGAYASGILTAARFEAAEVTFHHVKRARAALEPVQLRSSVAAEVAW